LLIFLDRVTNGPPFYSALYINTLILHERQTAQDEVLVCVKNRQRNSTVRLTDVGVY